MTGEISVPLHSATNRCTNVPVSQRRESTLNAEGKRLTRGCHVAISGNSLRATGSSLSRRYIYIYITNQILISEIVPRGTPIHHATRCVPPAERRKARVEVKFKLPSQGDATERSYAAEVICVRSTILGRGPD